MYSKEQFAKMMDSTLLKPTAARDDIIRCCEEAVSRHLATVVVFPFWLPVACEVLEDSDVKPATVVSFPFGATSRSVKVYEAKAAIAAGAKELDVVINVPALKSGEIEMVEREVAGVVEVTHGAADSGRITLKFIIECYYLSDDEKRIACEIIRDAGGDFIKTSTGTAPGGATSEDIRIIRGVVGADVGVKAAGGIRTTAQAMSMLDAGASRIGTSAAADIVDGYNPDDYVESAGRRK